MALDTVTPNPADNASAGTDPVVAGDPNSSATGPKPAGQGNDSAPPKKFEYTEDRTDWVPRRRLDEYGRKSAEKAVRDAEARFQSELASRDARIRALAGVDPVDPQAAEDAKVKAELERMYPHLGKLTPEKLDKIEALLANASGIEAATMSVYERHAESMVVQVEQAVEEELGKALTPRQRRAVRQAYADAAEEAFTARQRDPAHDSRNDFLARHDRGDKTLATETAEEFLKDWVEPVKRKVTNDAVQRNRVIPRGERGKPMTTQPAKLDLTKPGAFEEAMAAARRDEGRGYRE